MDLKKVSDYNVGDKKVKSIVMIKSISKGVTKNGDNYLNCIIEDTTGSIDAKMWSVSEEAESILEKYMIFCVESDIKEYKECLQASISDISGIDEENTEYEQCVRVACKTSIEKPIDMYNKIMAFSNKNIKDEKIKELVKRIYNDNKEKLMYYPAAKSMHHAYLGGLLEHSLSVLEISLMISKRCKSVDKDIIIAGALLHDVAKIKEIESNVLGCPKEYSIEGEILGHLVLGCEYVGKISEEIGVDEKNKNILKHIMISHHGKLEFGSAKLPMVIEAEIISYADNADCHARIFDDELKSVKYGEMSKRLYKLDNRKILNHKK